MTEPRITLVNLSRRDFLVGSVMGSAAAAGGLAIGCLLPARGAHAAQPQTHDPQYGLNAPATDIPTDLGPWIKVFPDGHVSIYVEKSEMGQGIHTALAMLVAEELEVDWEQIGVEPAVLSGPHRSVGTGASSSIRANWTLLRTAGAAAREMLRASAAERWGVAVSTCVVEHGRVVHRESKRTLRYGELVTDAARREVPQSVSLKPNESFRIIGSPVARKDIPDKVNGTAVFGIDVQVEGMLYGAPALTPFPGGKLVSANYDAARAQSGVRAIAVLPTGLAVIADHYWQAHKGKEALAAEFSGDLELDSETYSKSLVEALDTSGVLVHEAGEVSTIESENDLNNTNININTNTNINTNNHYSARYEVPFLAHAALEPVNCTASFKDGQCTVWAPTQSPSEVRKKVALALEIDIEDTTVHTTLMGGSFGRRSEVDDAVQAALSSREAGRPVKMIWSREDDTRNDFYRPACASELRARLDQNGRPIEMTTHIAGPWGGSRSEPAWYRRAVGWAEKKIGGPLIPTALPERVRRRFRQLLRRGYAGTVSGSGPAFHYDVTYQRLEYSLVDCELRIGAWRSVQASQNAFFIESFVDELAAHAGTDPYAYRRGIASPRQRGVLDRAAQMAGWENERPAGTALGIALFDSFGSSVCQVVEVSVDRNAAASELPRVTRVWSAIDCGQVINPNTVEAQIEGSIIYGLTAALDGKITLEKGRVRESNFHDYPLLGIAQVPEIEVSIIESAADPGGVGEPGTPPIAPALTNAIFAATGIRVRKLPVRTAFLQQHTNASAEERRASASQVG